MSSYHIRAGGKDVLLRYETVWPIIHYELNYENIGTKKIQYEKNKGIIHFSFHDMKVFHFG